MHNTGNPLGSKDILDLYDNSENIDYFANSQLDEHPDRFGTKRLTLAGLIKRSMALRNEINDFSGTLTFKPEWSDVPMNVSEGVGGEGGALNLQAEALGNRSEINKITSREALRRTYLEVGYNLVEGSFEEGGNLETIADVLLEEKTGKVYSWANNFPKVVNKGTLPSSEVGYVEKSKSSLNLLVSQKTNKLRINISAFGNTGTKLKGSTEGWENALSFAKIIAPLYTNNIEQSWYDLSGFEFVSDAVLYADKPLKLRSTKGAVILFSTAAADDFLGDYLVDTSIAVSPDPGLNRQPLHTRWLGNIDCRYKTSGFYIHDFFNFLIAGSVLRYTSYGIYGGDGNELIVSNGAIIQQWTYTVNGVGDLPSNIYTGTAILISNKCGDAKISGAVIAYYKERGIRVYGRSCFITSGTHIYSAGKQAIQQESTGGNLRIDGCWLDSSRILLLAEASLTNSTILTTPNTDSSIGVIVNGGDNVIVKNNTFFGSGGDSVYRDAVALSNKKTVISNNTYIGTVPNADTRIITPVIYGSTTQGTGIYTKQSGIWTCDGTWAEFEIEVSWSEHTGIGNIVVYNLPFPGSSDRRHVVSVWAGTSSLNTVTTGIIDPSAGGIKIYSGNLPTTMTGNGTLVIKGRYKI